MVESIGLSSVSGGGATSRVQSTTPAQPVPPAATKTETPAAPPTQLSGIAQALSATAPVDVERVAQIKRAIANGTFPILPSTIADRLLALRQGWSPNDHA